jgi:hydroxyacylglutathione hydrolase
MGMLKIIRRVIGMIGTNCYLVFDEDTKECVIIDPADNAPFILNWCRELSVTPAAVLLTHGHGDHISGVPGFLRAFRVPVYAGKEEEALLSDPSLNLSANLGEPVSIKEACWLEDNQEISMLGRLWQVISTPGHTPGSVCYYLEKEKVLFSGDTLFCESYGRTDFPSGSSRALTRSIREKLFILPEDVKVYPGHESETTIGHEKRYNPLSEYRGF